LIGSRGYRLLKSSDGVNEVADASNVRSQPSIQQNEQQRDQSDYYQILQNGLSRYSIARSTIDLHSGGLRLVRMANRRGVGAETDRYRGGATAKLARDDRCFRAGDFFHESLP